MKLQETFYTIVLHCDVCGNPTGEVVGSSLLGYTAQTNEAEYKQVTGMVDSRCDTCIVTHGSFKEMVEEYQRELKVSAGVAEDFVKINRKRADFDKEILKKAKKMV